MSPLVSRPRSLLVGLRHERLDQVHVPLDPLRASAGRRETSIVFASAFAVYAALGLYTTLALHLVLGDAESRLAHAYFAFWNEPAKLTAIGFYWPPLQTIVLLPFAAVRPLATSLAALPLQSALFAALLLTLLYRAFIFAGVARPLTAALTIAVGLNPMLVFFAVNGMAEMLALLLLTLALWLFVRWSDAPRWQHLVFTGLAFALGLLSRYELGFWIPLVVAGVVAGLVGRRASVQEIEAAVVALVVPAVYALALWTYVNWSLTGDPTAYLAVANAIQEAPHGTALGYVGKAFLVQGTLFPLSGLVLAALLVVGVRRRSGPALVLAGALLVNPLVTIAFAIHTREDVPLLLRYNMRSLPLAVLGGSWLLGAVPPTRRRAAGLALLAGIVLSAPATAATMLESRQQLGESSFLRGVASGESQDGRPGPFGPGLSVTDQREMAAYISHHVRGRDVILADDAQTFGVILADGHPGRYFDRIDRGEPLWFQARNHPVGRVGYLLVKKGSTRAEDPVFYDRILEAYPVLGSDKPPRFARLVHANRTFALYRVRRSKE